MSTEAENLALFRRFIDEFFNKRKFELAEELFHPEHYSPSLPLLPPGPEGMKIIAGVVCGIFTGFHRELEEVFASGDMIAARWTNSGTHDGVYMGVPPTGKFVKWWELAMVQFKEGKIAVGWYRPDEVGLLKELAPERLEWLHM